MNQSVLYKWDGSPSMSGFKRPNYESPGKVGVLILGPKSLLVHVKHVEFNIYIYMWKYMHIVYSVYIYMYILSICMTGGCFPLISFLAS